MAHFIIRSLSPQKALAGSLFPLFVLACAAGCRQENNDGAISIKKPTLPAMKIAPANRNANKGVDTVESKTHQSFMAATIQEPPVDQARPPDVTLAGKSVGKMYAQIAGEDGKGGLWEQIRFVSADGKPLNYSAVIQTKMGDMIMEFFPDTAPNHVRNFIALAKAGYYDGLQFDRAVHAESAEFSGKFHDFLEAGCPVGIGEAQFGSIGYWLKPEFSSKRKHEPGAVGAVCPGSADSAACRFYISLNKADWVDGQFTVFGRITSGLGVARRIFHKPRVDGWEHRPQNPVRIQKVLIRTNPSTY